MAVVEFVLFDWLCLLFGCLVLELSMAVLGIFASQDLICARARKRVPGPPNPWNKYCAVNCEYDTLYSIGTTLYTEFCVLSI